MRTGVCPKCDAREVHLVEKTPTELAIALGWTNTAFVNFYVCTKCGYLEVFVKDRKLLPNIAERYPKVG